MNIGLAFRPWGWGGIRFGWANHAVFYNNVLWGRRWDNRVGYVHPGYRAFARPAPGGVAHFEERHELHDRSERERSAGRYGHARVEEHEHGGDGHEHH